MAFSINTNPWNLNKIYDQTLQRNSINIPAKPLKCMPRQQQDDSGVMCESCSDKGWLLCDFCKGQKSNVKADNNRIYRRCPACKAIGCVLCPKCKVYKCLTFPDQNDGVELINF